MFVAAKDWANTDYTSRAIPSSTAIPIPFNTARDARKPNIMAIVLVCYHSDMLLVKTHCFSSRCSGRVFCKQHALQHKDLLGLCTSTNLSEAIQSLTAVTTGLHRRLQRLRKQPVHCMVDRLAQSVVGRAMTVVSLQTMKLQTNQPSMMMAWDTKLATMDAV